MNNAIHTQGKNMWWTSNEQAIWKLLACDEQVMNKPWTSHKQVKIQSTQFSIQSYVSDPTIVDDYFVVELGVWQ